MESMKADNANMINKAVVPVAGLGSRFMPITKVIPKVLLPVLNKPLLQYALEEVAEAGIREVALILSPGMEMVMDYLAPDEILENMLRERGRYNLLEPLATLRDTIKITPIYQTEPRGFGDAVSLAREWVGEEPFAIVLPDDMVFGKESALRQILNVHSQFGGGILAVSPVADDQVPYKGIVEGQAVASNVLKLSHVVEKPPLSEAPGNLAILGRYILTPVVFNELDKHTRGALGEIQLTDAIEASIASEPLFACQIEGEHIDAGTPYGLLSAANLASKLKT